MVLKSIADPNVGVYSVWLIGGVSSFDLVISWDII